MKIIDFARTLEAGRTVEVVFKKEVEYEGMFDEGCKAVLSLNEIDTSYNVLCFNADFSKYEEYNKQFYKPNYYDKDQVPCLKVYETSFYPKNKIEKVFMDFEMEADYYFEIVESSTTSIELYEKYEAETKKEIPYVMWLEKKLIDRQKFISILFGK